MKNAFLLLLLIFASVLLAGCGSNGNDESPYATEYNAYDESHTPLPEPSPQYQPPAPTLPPEETPTAPPTYRDENLAKLAKVWGFVKYTHNSFITGQLDWDTELLALIPIIYESSPEDVNGILYDWFVGLGEDGYDLAREQDFHDVETRPMADLSWVNSEYLGPLAAHLCGIVK